MAEDSRPNRRSFLAGLGGTLALLSIPSAGCSSAEQGVPARKPAGRLADLDTTAEFDVCIIGSGFAGAALGESLVKRGIKTIVLESGFESSGPPIDARLQPLEVFRSSGPLDYPVARTRFRAVGGTSWLWGGFCTRFQPMDLEDNAFTPRDCSWPIRYSDLEPYYELAEKALAVSGAPETPLHPTRKSTYPLPLEIDDSYLRSLFAKAGVSASPQARAIPATRVALTHLPALQSSRYGALIQGGTVTRLLTDGAGRVIAAETKDLERNATLVRALVYVVACGGLESPRLLLLSRAAEFPNGIGNNHDVAGRYFMEHSNVGFTARVPVGVIRVLRDRAFDTSFQYYKEFKEEQLGGIRLDTYVDSIRRRDLAEWQFKSVAGKLWTPELRIGAGVEMQPSAVNRVTLDPEARDHFGNSAANVYVSDSPADLKTRDRARQVVRRLYGALGARDLQESPRGWAHHHLGTCRMGNNPQTSVVDKDLRVHGTTNLFVAGSAVFVTSGCSGPTLTLTALSLRLADHLRGQLSAGAFSRASASLGRTGALAVRS
jgi:choline dehydrogenase-like flavoprotein